MHHFYLQEDTNNSSLLTCACSFNFFLTLDEDSCQPDPAWPPKTNLLAINVCFHRSEAFHFHALYLHPTKNSSLNLPSERECVHLCPKTIKNIVLICIIQGKTTKYPNPTWAISNAVLRHTHEAFLTSLRCLSNTTAANNKENRLVASNKLEITYIVEYALLRCKLCKKLMGIYLATRSLFLDFTTGSPSINPSHGQLVLALHLRPVGCL